MNQAASAAVFQKRGPARSAVRQREVHLSVLFIIAVLAFIAGLRVGGALGLALTSAATLVATWIVLCVGGTILPTSISFKTVVCVYGSQSVAQLLLALAGVTTTTSGGYGMNLADHSGTLALGHLSLLAGTLLTAVVWGVIVRRQHPRSIDLTQRPTAQTRFALIVALLLNISQPILRLAIPDSSGWVLGVLTGNLEATGFFVGWFAGDLGAVANGAVLVALVVNCVVGGLLGTRYPIVLLALYLVGRLVSPRERHRRRFICASLAAAVPIVFVFSIVGDVRVKRGRGSLDLLEASRLSEFGEAVLASRSSYQAKGTDPIGDTLSRLYAWPNAASTILTPDPIPYRGFAQWASKCLSYLQIWGWSSGARERFFEDAIGTGHASDYGFTNNVASTVEFGVLADGWSTAGPVGVLVLGALVMLALCMSEEFVLYTVRQSCTGQLVFVCILIKACINCYVYPAPWVIRYIVLNTFFWVVVLKIVNGLSSSHQGAARHHNRYSMLVRQ
jgi:hypothetical protein